MAAAAIVHGEVGINLIMPLGIYKKQLSEDKLKGFPDAPDLAVEVVSPTDKHYDVTEKALAYLKAGTRLVWVIEPLMKTVMVYRSETDIMVLNYEDTLTGEDVVQGFRVLLRSYMNRLLQNRISSMN